jgi:hypothetical protein
MEYARFTDDIPSAYDRGLGPVIFHDFADHTARHVAALGPQRAGRDLRRHRHRHKADARCAAGHDTDCRHRPQ